MRPRCVTLAESPARMFDMAIWMPAISQTMLKKTVSSSILGAWPISSTPARLTTALSVINSLRRPNRLESHPLPNVPTASAPNPIAMLNPIAAVSAPRSWAYTGRRPISPFPTT